MRKSYSSNLSQEDIDFCWLPEFRQKPISGQDFVSVLELCLRKSDYFSFIQAIWPSHTDKSLEHDLQPFLVKTIVSPIWFGYDYTSVSKRNS